MGTKGNTSPNKLVRRKSTGSSEKNDGPKINRRNSMNNKTIALWCDRDYDSRCRGHGGDQSLDDVLSLAELRSNSRSRTSELTTFESSNMVVDPGKLGLIDSESTYVKIDYFDDYPTSIYEVHSYPKDLRSTKIHWIRKSFEQLDVITTTQKDLFLYRKLSGSVGNLSRSTLSIDCCAKELSDDDGEGDNNEKQKEETYL